MCAIGREMGSFTIAKTGEETGGRINDTAKSKEGMTCQCFMYSVTKWDGQVRHLPRTASPKVIEIPC